MVFCFLCCAGLRQVSAPAFSLVLIRMTICHSKCEKVLVTCTFRAGTVCIRTISFMSIQLSSTWPCKRHLPHVLPDILKQICVVHTVRLNTNCSKSPTCNLHNKFYLHLRYVSLATQVSLPFLIASSSLHCLLYTFTNTFEYLFLYDSKHDI